MDDADDDEDEVWGVPDTPAVDEEGENDEGEEVETGEDVTGSVGLVDDKPR